ncbi:hypothetical protein LZ30DRAFT_605947 [Colletotrichum cereale]|nr:hypothetical protein LZ30DRAFT_605947 [Colletotrichum cereale]
MAKPKPLLSLPEIETILGYSVGLFAPSDADMRFYSDLTPIPQGVYEETLREFEEYRAGRLCSHQFSLPLKVGHGSNGTLFRLPREVRDQIYSLAIPQGVWEMDECGHFDRNSFPGALGDPTEYYYPLARDIALLRVSKNIREEALPLAYRHTLFRLHDLDDLLKLLMAVGKVGRDNIQSIQFPWESKSESEERWKDCSDPNGLCGTLPRLHVSKCAQLLRQCRRLRLMRLQFQEELFTTVSLSDFQADPGIRGLLDLPKIRKVEICDMAGIVIKHDLATWLKTKIEILEGNYCMPLARMPAYLNFLADGAMIMELHIEPSRNKLPYQKSLDIFGSPARRMPLGRPATAIEFTHTHTEESTQFQTNK